MGKKKKKKMVRVVRVPGTGATLTLFFWPGESYFVLS